ncbi:MAG TPA: signal peptidase II [Actinomycetota bacterium]|nr:signal peptidase II [Actinomycetota bacterium]
MRLGRSARLAGALYLAAGAIYAADRVTKLWAERSLAGHPPIVLIPKVLQLSYTTNAGGAFGLFGGQPWLFFGATVAVCVAIVALSARLASRITAVALGLILGGALGNLTDRIIHGPAVSGRVTDFIDLHVWPVFNLADSGIVIGAFLIVVSGFSRDHRAANSPGNRLED